MQKKPLEISCYVLGAGAFGVFLRWLQNMLAFDEQGLVEASAFNLLVPAIITAAVFVFRRFVKDIWANKLYVSKDFCEALFNPGRLFAIARWFIGGIMCLGALILLISSETDMNATFIRVLCATAFLSGIAFPIGLNNANYEDMGNVKLLRIEFFLPILLYAVWLILSYKENSYNSVVWSYILEMATIMVAMLGYFRIAGFAYYAPDPKKCIFTLMMGTMLCVMSLADERYMGMQLILFSTALMFLLYIWILYTNLKKKQPKQDDSTRYDEGGFEHI